MLEVILQLITHFGCVVLKSRTERDAKRMHELELRIQTENARNKSLNDELLALKVWIRC